MSITRTKAAVAAVVACGAISIAAVAWASSSNDREPSAQDKVGLLKRAYPSLGATAPVEARNGSMVLASADFSRADGKPASITANDDGTLCFITEGAGTCVPGDRAVTDGVFISAIDCKAARVTVYGITPVGTKVSRTLTPGTDSKTTVGSGGVVTIDVAGLNPGGVQLDNGATNSLAYLDGVCATP